MSYQILCTTAYLYAICSVVYTEYLYLKKKKKKKACSGTSQAVQWLGLHASTAWDTGSIPGQELRSGMLYSKAKKKKKPWSNI